MPGGGEAWADSRPGTRPRALRASRPAPGPAPRLSGHRTGQDKAPTIYGTTRIEGDPPFAFSTASGEPPIPPNVWSPRCPCLSGPRSTILQWRSPAPRRQLSVFSDCLGSSGGGGRGTPPCGLRRLPFLSFLLFCMRCCDSDVMPGTNSSFRDGIFYPASSFWGGECPRGLQGSHPRKVDTGLTRLGHAIRTCSTDVEITPSGCFSPPRGSVGGRPF